jgi:O-antigen/teichoic acid export membrane protein
VEALRQTEIFLTFGIGMMLAKFLHIASQVIMGRTLGPEIYGKITIILLLSSYFSLPMVSGWGMVFTKISAKEQDVIKKYQSLKALLLVVSLCCILTVSCLSILRRPLAHLLDIDSQMMYLSIAMTVSYAWLLLVKRIAQGFQDWHRYIIIENICAAYILAGILGLTLWAQFNLVTVSTVFFAGYFLAGLIFTKNIRKSFSVKINPHYIQDILSHGWFLLLNALVGVATLSIDCVLINKILGAEEAGIYQAHFFSTDVIISAFTNILLIYIFPIFCRDKDNNVNKVIKKLNKVQYIGVTAVSVITGGAILWIYAFPVSLPLFGSLCLFNAVHFHLQLKTWYLASRGANESKITLQAQLIFLVINVVMLVISVQYIGILAGGISLLTAACASLAYLIKSEHTILLRQ